ncbi:hypothetical protein BUZ03_08265 [Staphylococcus gallinarum]|uniref:HesA/MoeB/ThiF family protein n=1 Tax=Staphylococcus gallinarum TaxID=1293 RepID=UPI000D1E34C7|nr:ThiF family adenylyltransferase [Staphylococcus gallinarum]PTK90488.1 hypothetical protein BUZ03_08265 [Staphylococcus gallinarum]
MEYSLRRFQKVHKLGNDIYIGNMPPNARYIENAPQFLSQLLQWLSFVKSDSEIIDYIRNISNLSSKEASKLLKELIEKDILIQDPKISDDRYSRHALYYNMMGINQEESQKKLKSKKVALVGMGGIGSNIAMNLVGAGIGEFLLVDGDTIETSNLTRQFLYNEDEIGEFKVVAAKRNLKKLNSECKIQSVNSEISNKEELAKMLAGTDFVILSADSPSEIHDWMDYAANEDKFAYSNAGYIENFGVVGPLTIPNLTTQYHDYKYIGDLDKFSNNENEVNSNLNENYQAPSYGPLNTLVSSIQSNEVIRYFLGEDCRSKGTRLLIDSSNYSIVEEKF